MRYKFIGTNNNRSEEFHLNWTFFAPFWFCTEFHFNFSDRICKWWRKFNNLFLSSLLIWTWRVFILMHPIDRFVFLPLKMSQDEKYLFSRDSKDFPQIKRKFLRSVRFPPKWFDQILQLSTVTLRKKQKENYKDKNSLENSPSMVSFVWPSVDERQDTFENVTKHKKTTINKKKCIESIRFTLQAASRFLQSSMHDGWQWKTWHRNELSAQWMMTPQKLKIRKTKHSFSCREFNSSLTSCLFQRQEMINIEFDIRLIFLRNSIRKSTENFPIIPSFCLNSSLTSFEQTLIVVGEIVTDTGIQRFCSIDIDNVSIAGRKTSIPPALSTEIQPK